MRGESGVESLLRSADPQTKLNSWSKPGRNRIRLPPKDEIMEKLGRELGKTAIKPRAVLFLGLEKAPIS
jgi:hypothetical protein